MNLQALLDKYQIRVNMNMLIDLWNESHRHWHNSNHLYDILEQIDNDNIQDDTLKEKLYLTALFHDIVYEPTRNDNEEKSADFMMSLCENKSNPAIQDVYSAILDTKTHASETPLSESFNKYDMNIVERDFNQLLNWERGIQLEFIPHFGLDSYKKGRIKFLESLIDKYPHNSENLIQLIDWVKTNY